MPAGLVTGVHGNLARPDTTAMADNAGAGDISETVDVSFHGVNYLLTVSTINGDTMCIEVEQKSDASRWRGDFTSRYIEDITSKTGNFKKFPVFVKMLLSALKQASDSVFVDLLTYQDLEILKARKAGGNTTSQQQQSRGLAPNNKRYLILTYAAEFDRVHYPLPLLFEDNPDPQHLRAVIASLRSELDTLSADRGDVARGARGGAAGVGADAPVELRRLREENSALRQQLRLLEKAVRGGDQDGGGGEGRGGAEVRDMTRELKMVRKERDLLQARIEVSEAELERERGLHRRELRKKAKENQDVYGELSLSREQVRQLKEQVRKLLEELESRRRHHPMSSSDRMQGTYGRGSGAGDVAGRPYSAGSRNGSRGASPSHRGPLYPKPHDASTRARDTSSRERGAGGHPSRGASPSTSRPTSAPAARSPNGQRFDPTEYVRQQRELAAARRGGSAGSSRAPTPPRSVASSGRASPAAHSRPASADGGRGLSPASSRPPSYDGGLGSRSRHGSTERQGRPLARDVVQPTRSRGSSPGGASAGWSKFPTNEISQGRVSNSRPQSAQRSASPGRALQEVKRKLSEYVTKRSIDDLSTTSSLPPSLMPSAGAGAGPSQEPPLPTTSTTAPPNLTSQSSSKSQQLFNDASAEIADIDGRLHALQKFLRMAKASAPSVSSNGLT